MEHEPKFGSFLYYILTLHAQPNAYKHMAMVIQLGYESTQVTQCADALDCISIQARPIESLLPDERGGKEESTTRALLLKQVREGAVLIVFQVKRVIYTEGKNEGGEMVKKQEFIGDKSVLYGTIGGMEAQEGLLLSHQRHEYLHAKIIGLIRPPPS